MSKTERSLFPRHLALVVAGTSVVMAGCLQTSPQLPQSLAPAAPIVSAPSSPVSERRQLLVEPVPTPAASAATSTTRPSEPVAKAAQPAVSAAPAVLNLEQVSLGTFAQVVFADFARKNVNIDPQVLARRDLVTFRSGAGQVPEQIEAAARLLLKSYGIAAIDVGGLVRVVPDNASLGNLPEIRRGAAMPETPLPLRPIFHLVDLQAVRQSEVMGFLRTLFGDRIRLQEDAIRNAILLSGTPDNVAAALEAIRVLDQPALLGGTSIALTPTNSSADEFARRLFDVLTAQGYAVQPLTGQATGFRSPIILLPIVGLNTVYVFARGQDVLRHIESLALTLDKPADRGIGRNFFTYQVKHKDASSLADTLESLLTGARTRTPSTPAAGSAAPPTGAAATPRSSGVVVDRTSNTLIFQASQDEYAQLVALLQRLDQPAKAALIEVTVAELSLDDNSQLGVEWILSRSLGDGNRLSLGTLGGLSIGKGGLDFRVLNSLGEARAVLNALASDNKANILSSPRVMARNGETATIQVGQEVPIITSQATGISSGANQGQLLQTIQYRSTGVIMKVRPVIHSSDQIDLDVTQEVSAASQTETGVNASPTISTRKLETKLTLQNGSTVLLGGLISEERSSGTAGIPLLKDIPVIGSAFGKQSTGGRRRELIVLITPYIIGSNREAEELTRAFRGMLQPWGGPSAAPLNGKSESSRPAPGSTR